MSPTILQDIAYRIKMAGWTVATIEEPHWLAVWHSNGDDLAHLSCANELWEGHWEDRHGQLMEGFVFGNAIPASCADVERIATAIIARLTADDPICERCGSQGHTKDKCDLRTLAEAEAAAERRAFLRAEIALSIADARREGYDGPDAAYELTQYDCESITEVLGYKPTRQEWADAGYRDVGNAHIADEDSNQDENTDRKD